MVRDMKKGKKTAVNKVAFPCSVCDKASRLDTIQCNKCSMWVHRECVKMSPNQMTIVYASCPPAADHRRHQWRGWSVRCNLSTRRPPPDILKSTLSNVNYDLRKYFFANRIITIWNSLPDNVVSSTSVNMVSS